MRLGTVIPTPRPEGEVATMRLGPEGVEQGRSGVKLVKDAGLARPHDM